MAEAWYTSSLLMISIYQKLYGESPMEMENQPKSLQDHYILFWMNIIVFVILYIVYLYDQYTFAYFMSFLLVLNVLTISSVSICLVGCDLVVPCRLFTSDVVVMLVFAKKLENLTHIC